MKIWTSLLFALLFAFQLQAQTDYNIKIEIKNYPQDTLLIGYKFGDKQYIKDTLRAEKKGKFVFKGTDTLKNGIYLAVLQPKKDFVEFMVDKNDHHFSMSADANDLANSLKFKHSHSNKIFQEYGEFLKKERPKAEKLRKEIHVQDSLKNDAKKKELEKEIEKIDNEVAEYQKKFIKENAGTLPALMVKGLSEPTIPEFEGDEKEVRTKKYYYYRNHYFDNFDFSDERLLYTNFFDNKVNFYVDKLIPQHPDTISGELDVLLKKMEPNKEMYKYYLISFLNKYASSKMVGFDAIYVHLVKEYYAKGKTPWVDEDQLAKILRDAFLLEPVLIGKKAPNITLYKKDGSSKSIYDVDKPYTLLFFWSPDCGHCKKAAPYLVKFFKEFKDQVEIITICNELGSEKKVNKCWEGVKEDGFDDMINLVDPKYLSHFKTVYNVKSTPTIYILNKDKEIIMKRIPAKDLPDVMRKLIDYDNKNKK
ncbi:MAG TPA: DUF5106 domain-containing protein [Saprospiraceae bacterium]|nr:DUF5106 domain-containing protein [Saprospiraceae bacterium]